MLQTTLSISQLLVKRLLFGFRLVPYINTAFQTLMYLIIYYVSQVDLT